MTYYYVKISYWDQPSDMEEFHSKEDAMENYAATIAANEGEDYEYICIVACKPSGKELLAKHHYIHYCH